jgi:hypothetical protein
MNPAYAKAATELLAFYLEAGVDALVGEAPVDRLPVPVANQIRNFVSWQPKFSK